MRLSGLSVNVLSRIAEKARNKVTINEKHELTLSFNSSEELWSFAQEYKEKIVSVSDYKIYTCNTEPQTAHVESEE